MAASTAELLLKIKGDSSSAQRALKDVQGTAKGMGSALGKLASVAGTLGVAAFLKSSITAAMQAQASWKRLETAVNATGASYSALQPRIRSLIEAESRLSAYSGGQLRTALSNLTLGTGDATKAMDLLGLTADIARGRQMDLSKAAILVAKVAAGNTSILKRYGITLKENATTEEALAALQERFAGQAEAYGDSAAGAQEKLANSITRLKVTIGSELLPTATKLAEAMTALVDSFLKLSPHSRELAIRIAGVTTAVMLLLPWIAKLKAAFVTLGGASALGGMTTLLSDVAVGFTLAAEGAGVLSVASLGLLPALGAAAFAIGGVTAALIVFYETMKPTQIEGQRLANAMMVDRASFEQLKAAVDEGTITWQQVYNAMSQYGQGALTTAESQRIAFTVTGQLATATGALGSSMNATTADVESATTAIQALTAAQDEARNASLTLAEAQLAHERADIRVADAQAALTKLQESGKAKARELRDASLDLREAKLAHARAADRVTEAEKANASAVSAVGTAIKNLPPSKVIKVTAQTSQAESGLNRLKTKLEQIWEMRLGINMPSPNIGPRAAGGPVQRGNLYLVGERGPELFVAPRSGFIVPANKTNAMMSNGPQYTINVTANSAADIPAIKAAVEQVLKSNVRRATQLAY